MIQRAETRTARIGTPEMNRLVNLVLRFDDLITLLSVVWLNKHRTGVTWDQQESLTRQARKVILNLINSLVALANQVHEASGLTDDEVQARLDASGIYSGDNEEEEQERGKETPEEDAETGVQTEAAATA